jgi:hypothetical protein
MRYAITRSRPGRRGTTVRPVSTQVARGSLRAHAVQRAHEALDEVPGVLRRLKTFLLVGSITMAAFAAGMLIVLWHAVR